MPISENQIKELLKALEKGNYNAEPAIHYDTYECSGDRKECTCWLGKTIPPIGMVVLRFSNYKLDSVAQVRIGDEQNVLVWASDRSRYQPGHYVWGRSSSS
jgi:hypothetical protein